MSAHRHHQAPTEPARQPIIRNLQDHADPASTPRSALCRNHFESLLPQLDHNAIRKTQDSMQAAGSPVIAPLHSSRLFKLAMLIAVPCVFLLAYLDLRREQELSLQDFSAEQQSLAHFAAVALEARFAAGHAGDATDDAIKRFLLGLRQNKWRAKSAAPTRFILVDAERRWLLLDVTDEEWQSASTSTPSDFSELIARMAAGDAGEEGAFRLSRAAADSIHLGQRTAVAGFAPVVVPGGRRLSVGLVTSAMRVRDRARLDIWRLAIATGLAGFLVAAFGLVIARQDRRAQQLAEALRLANTTAALHRDLARAEKLATIGTLAAGVAHEIGTPLGIISGRAEQLLEKWNGDENASVVERGDHGNLGDPVRKGLSSIIDQVEKVSVTIRQLLDFARVRPVETIAVSPAQALVTACALLEHRFRQTRVALQLDAPSSLPAVAADPGQLEQVLVNLLINACDACATRDSETGGHIAARAFQASNSNRVTIEITDDGAGISPEHLPQVFDPFFTTKKRGHGTGLGLSIAADIVKNHGGTIEVESELGRGTTMRMVLPAATSIAPKKDSP